MSEELNTTQSELTPDEQALIAAYRAQNVTVAAELFAKFAATSEPEPAPVPAPQREPISTLNSAERLSLYIIGHLALTHWWTNLLYEDRNLTALWEETTRAIEAGLPHLDFVEIHRLYEGKR